MNSRSIPAGRFLALTALLIFLAGLPAGSRANDAAYSSALPIIMAPPGVLIVDDEESLRAAIEMANRAGQFPRIELTADIALTAPLPALVNPRAGTAIIAGNGHTLDGNRVGSVLAVGADTRVEIERLEITDGSGSGGGISVYAGSNKWLELTINNSTLSGNQAGAFVGGAIFSATYEGYITTHISRSTIAFNSAPEGGGLSNQGSFYGHGQADAIIKNSTFSANVSSGKGGAISNVDNNPFLLLGAVQDEWASGDPAPQGGIGGANIQLLYSTVSDNQAAQGSGIWNDVQSNFQSTGSIIAGNEESGRNCWQPIISRGHNLDGDGSCGLAEPTDLANGQAALRPLALVPPGDTATHALGPDSEALDRIPAGEFGCDPASDTDQRGVVRPQPVGGIPGKESWTFRALEPDVAVISLEHSQISGRNTEGIWTYRLTVTVEPAAE